MTNRYNIDMTDRYCRYEPDAALLVAQHPVGLHPNTQALLEPATVILISILADHDIKEY